MGCRCKQRRRKLRHWWEGMSLASRLSKMEQRITMLEAANANLSGQLHDLLTMLEKEEEDTPTAIDFISGTPNAERDETQSLG